MLIVIYLYYQKGITNESEVKQMKKFMIYMDDGRDCFKIAVSAKNEKEARQYVEGNGEIIAVKDVTKDYPISIDKVVDALINANFGCDEIAFIERCLTINNIAE